MADSVDRVFGHALNTVNKIRPGSQKPPLSDRQELYGLYKQSMEGDVAEIADRPTAPPSSSASSLIAAGAAAAGIPSSSTTSSSENLRKEQEKWDAWKSNEGLSRTEAKRRYIEKLIDTMHKYASFTPEARELVEELEFVWDQIKNNSVGTHSGSSERSSPLRGGVHGSGAGDGDNGGGGGAPPHGDDDDDEQAGYLGRGSAAVAAMEGAQQQRREGEKLMRVLSPVSQVEEEELRREADEEKDEEEFVDAPISQVDDEDLGVVSEGDSGIGSGGGLRPLSGSSGGSRVDVRWRRRIESGLMKLTLEVAALREQLESRRYLKLRSRQGFLGWVLRLSWWAVQLFVADAVILWIVILYMRRKNDHRLEMAVRVLLGDAVAQVQKVGNQVKMPTLPRMPGRKQT